MFLQPFSFLGATAGASAVNPTFASLVFADPGTGTPDTLTATYTYGGFDTLVAYIATRNGGTALSALQLVNDEGTYLERVVVDPFSEDTFDLSSFTATSEAATRIDMVIAEKNNGGFSAVQTVTVSGLDFTSPTRSSIATDSSAGTTVIVTYNENIYGTEDTADWTISGHTISGVAISGTTVTLTITPAIANGDSDTLSYSGGDLADGDGNAVAAFTTQAITNNVPSGSVDATEVGSVVFGAGTTTATISSVALGAETASREFLVIWSGRAGGSAFVPAEWQVTINGVSTSTTVIAYAPSNNAMVYAWRLSVPTGTTSDVVLTRISGSLTLSGGVLTAIRMTGTPTLGTPVTDFLASIGTPTGTLTVDITPAAGSAVLVACSSQSTTGISVTGATEVDQGGNTSTYALHAFDAGVAGSLRTIETTHTCSVSSADGSLLAVEISA